ncbi:hypothetical protein [Hyphomicrobium sp. 2TAF46]|uniref:hypothetical protein n=1 Tax=Hyphomicrobium sp. 2TAF46 TaxID=3233019 RepID=UPI003F91BB9D
MSTINSNASFGHRTRHGAHAERGQMEGLQFDCDADMDAFSGWPGAESWLRQCCCTKPLDPH